MSEICPGLFVGPGGTDENREESQVGLSSTGNEIRNVSKAR
jgi:hypothetical protein